MPRSWSNRRVTDYQSSAQREKAAKRSGNAFGILLVLVAVFFITVITTVTVRALTHPPAVSDMPTGQNP